MKVHVSVPERSEGFDFDPTNLVDQKCLQLFVTVKNLEAVIGALPKTKEPKE